MSWRVAAVTTKGHDRIGWRQLDHFLNRRQLVEEFLLGELKSRLNRAQGNRFSSGYFPLAQPFEECELHHFLLRFGKRTDHVLQKICQVRVRWLEIMKPGIVSEFSLQLGLKSIGRPAIGQPAAQAVQ